MTSYQALSSTVLISEKVKMKSSVVFIANRSSPLVVAVDILEGSLHVGQLLQCNNTIVGYIDSMEKDGMPIENASSGMVVAVKFRDAAHSSLVRGDILE